MASREAERVEACDSVGFGSKSFSPRLGREGNWLEDEELLIYGKHSYRTLLDLDDSRELT